MNKDLNILHVTDLHIHDVKSLEEHLREEHFDEYINDLSKEVKKLVQSPIDCLAITGDFIDCGKIDNFSHATRVVEHLSDSLGITKNSVVVCPGNHDLIKDAELAGNHSEARKDYWAFSNKWAHSDQIECSKNNRASLTKIGSNLWVLSLDSTLGAKQPFLPGPGHWLASENPDEPLSWLKKHLKDPDAFLLILSHYPVEEFQTSMIPDEEDNFAAKHIWTRAKSLAKRIGKLREQAGARTLWLSGDVHAEYRDKVFGIDFITSGRLGTRVNRGSVQHRQAKIIHIPIQSDKTKIFTLNYQFDGHIDRADCGDWVPSPHVVISDRRKAVQRRNAKKGIGLKSIAVPSADPSAHSSVAADKSVNVETVDLELEKEIVNRVASKRLYSIGRFDTHNEETSLSWVSISPLLNSDGILPLSIRTLYRWLKGRIGGGGSNILEKTVFIGIDCWGAVIASQLSILSGAPNFCVASRGDGTHYTTHELIDKSLIKQIKESRNIVLVHDVVSTGRSLRLIHDQILKQIGAKRVDDFQWYAVSLICDNIRSREGVCDFLTAHGTACGSLRMPTLMREQLPDARILVPMLSFGPSIAPKDY